MLILGDADDARGFALIGATAIRCRTREDVMRALSAAGAPTIVIVSPRLAAFVPTGVNAIVLPEPEARP